MLVLCSASSLGFEFSLNQPSQEILDGLSEKFIEKYGEEVYIKAVKIIISEPNFFNVIKDRYGPTLIGEDIESLGECVEQHLII